MSRSKTAAYVLLILTLIPWAFWIGIIVWASRHPDPAAYDESMLTVLGAVALGVTSLTLGLIIYYIVHLYTKSGLPGPMRALWLVLIVFMNLFAMPVYWLLYVWSKQDVVTTPDSFPGPPPPIAEVWRPTSDLHPVDVGALSTAGELLDASIVLTRRNYWRILRAALPALVLAFTVEALLELLGASTDTLGMMASLIPWALVEGLCIACCWYLLHGAAPTFGDSWRMISPRLGTVIISYALKWAAILIGLVLLIVPGLLVMVRFFGLPTLCITEQASLGLAVRRSLGLSRGRFKVLAATVGLVEILVFVLPMLIPPLLPGGSWESPSPLDTVGASVIYMMLMPFRAAVLTTLYLSLRMSKEGYDLSVSLGNLSRGV